MNGIKKSIHIKGDLEYLLFRVVSELEDNPNELKNDQLDHFPEGSNEEKYSKVGPVVVEVEEKPKMMKLYIRGPIKSYAERKNALKTFPTEKEHISGSKYRRKRIHSNTTFTIFRRKLKAFPTSL